MSIYRYNMLRRKAEGPCKVCVKRDRQEAEAKRRQEVLGMLRERPRCKKRMKVQSFPKFSYIADAVPTINDNNKRDVRKSSNNL